MFEKIRESFFHIQDVLLVIMVNVLIIKKVRGVISLVYYKYDQ